MSAWYQSFRRAAPEVSLIFLSFADIPFLAYFRKCPIVNRHRFVYYLASLDGSVLCIGPRADRDVGRNSLLIMNVHFRGLQNRDKASVLLSPKVLVCLECGFSWFTLPKPELEQLGEAASAFTTSSQKDPRGA